MSFSSLLPKAEEHGHQCPNNKWNRYYKKQGIRELMGMQSNNDSVVKRSSILFTFEFGTLDQIESLNNTFGVVTYGSKRVT